MSKDNATQTEKATRNLGIVPVLALINCIGVPVLQAGSSPVQNAVSMEVLK
jgi:hypothetical protein